MCHLQMNQISLACMALMAVSCTGCALVAPSSQPNELLAAENSSHTKVAQDQPSWDWVLAIPNDAPRAELIQPIVSHQLLTRLLPGQLHGEIALVSGGANMPSDRVILKVNETPISNWGQLLDVSEFAMNRSGASEAKHVDIVLGSTASPANTQQTIRVSPETLASLVQSASANSTVIRVSDGGNSAIVIRENGIQCKLSTRIERQTGILHIVLALRSTIGEKKLLPVEISAASDGNPLRCLTVADTLELLYGDHQNVTSTATDPDLSSFANVSEREDYLIPTNYKRLLNSDRSRELTATSGPALATVPGTSYPGPAILGDARALTQFMLQRAFVSSADSSTGWVMFAGDLQNSSTIDIDLDLGNGPRRVRLTVPHQ